MDAPMIAPMLVSALLNTYAPRFPKPVAAGICQIESGGDSWGIYDNTAGRSYRPKSYADAVATANALLLQRHVIDMGVMGIDSVHLSEPGVTVEAMFHPGPNLVASQRIFLADLTAAHGDVRAALSLYNSGSPTASLAYADKVLTAASSSSYGLAIVAGGQFAQVSHPVEVVRRASPIGVTFDAFRGTPW
jgi:type IV secretion system protein VirB1